MDRRLRLEVILAAIDKASGPLKAITGSSKGAAAAVKAARDTLRDLESQSKRISAFRQGARDIAVTGNTLDQARAKVRALAQEMQASEAPSKALTRSFEAARREAAQLKDRHAALTAQQQRLRTELQAAGVPLKGLANHQAELRLRTAAATTELERQTAALKAQGAHLKKLNAARSTYDKTIASRDRIAGAGASSLAAGGGVLYAGMQAIQPGIEFDSTMSRVQALTRLEKNDPALAALRAQARQLGAETMFSAPEAAQGMAFLAMAGFTPEAIRAAMPGLLDTALAGKLELGRAADIASNILTGFKLDPAKMARVSDVLVGTFTRANVDMEMLGETMKYVGPIAASMGTDLETAAAMAGKLGDAGIQGSMAGTAMRAIMGRLAAPPKMARDALDELNIKTKDAAGNMRPIADLLTEIHSRTAKLGTADRAGFFKAIAGEEAFAGLEVLVNQAGSGKLQELVTTLRAADGEARKVGKTMADNLTGDLDELSSATDDLRITLFETNEGAMRDTVKWLTEIVGGIGQWASANPGLVSALSKVAIITAFVVAGFGGLALALAAMLGPFAVLRYGMALFGIQGARVGTALWALARGAIPALLGGLRLVLGLLVANPIGAAIAILAGAAFLVWQNWDTVAGWLRAAWGEITTAFSGGLVGVARLILDWSLLGHFYRSFAGVMSYFGVELPAKFTDFGANLLDGMIRGITSRLGATREAISNVGDSVVGWFKDKLGIHSPSRVFAELGGFTMAGLAQGLERGQGGPLGAINTLARQLTATTALGLAAIGPAGAGVAIDNRPPLSARAAAPVAAGGDHIEIHIHAAPGMDTEAIARAVAAELDRRDREKAARGRARLSDRD